MHCFSAMNTVRFSGLWLAESFLDNRRSLSLRSTGYFRSDEHAWHRARPRSHRRGHFHFHELALDGRYLSSFPKRNARHLAAGRSPQLYRGEFASPLRSDRLAYDLAPGLRRHGLVDAIMIWVARKLSAAGLNGTIDAINMENYETCGYWHLSFPDAVVASACDFAATLSCQTDPAVSRSCNRHRRRQCDSNGSAKTQTVTESSVSNCQAAKARYAAQKS
jgi:hypothetical protein